MARAKAATSRRMRKPKTAAQIAASKKNLEKARAARARAARAKAAKKAPTKAAKKAPTKMVRKATSSTSSSKRAKAKASVAAFTKRVNATEAAWGRKHNYGLGPNGMDAKMHWAIDNWSGGRIKDYQHWGDYIWGHRAKDKKGRSNAAKFEAYLLANPNKRMPDPLKSLKAQTRAASMRKKAKGWRAKETERKTIWHDSASGKYSDFRKPRSRRRRRRKTTT